MLTANAKKQIIDNISKDVERYSLTIDEFDVYLNDRVDYEYNKMMKNSDNYESLALYMGKYDPAENNDKSLVFEDFIGKSEKLNVYNSCEQNILYVDKVVPLSVNDLFRKCYKNLLSSINNFITNLYNARRKLLVLFSILFFGNLSLILYNLALFLALGIINFVYYFLLYKSIRCLFYIKFVLLCGKNNNMPTLLINITLILINTLISVLKFILSLIRGILNLFGKFLHIIEDTFTFLVKTGNTGIYSKILTQKINRNERSVEHKGVLSSIYKKSHEIFKSLNVNNHKYLKNFKFLRMKKEILLPNVIENNALREFIFELEKKEKKDIKKILYGKEIKIALDKLSKRETFLSCEIEIPNNIKKTVDMMKLAGSDLNGTFERNIEQ
ncbi:MAG: hypothetical protein LBS34_03250 [Rickettsiales bacterium]|jgi:hypothetical protein|nr:hypothetical protein [Rickettsiales bacterium]